MTALPKKKLSKARSGRRAATKSIRLPNLIVCQRCGNLKISHAACSTCGYYKDRLIFEIKEKTKVTKVKEP